MFGQRTVLFVREHVAVLKLRDTYDLLDVDTQTILGQVKDEPADWAKWLRLLVSKSLLPTTLQVYGGNSAAPLLSIHKRSAFLWTRLEIRDGQGRILACLRSRVFTLGGSFQITDAMGAEIGEIQGDWKGWEYSATLQGRALGAVTKKWAGILKEAFSNADQYLVQAYQAQDLPLMLGLALAVDVVYKERQR